MSDDVLRLWLPPVSPARFTATEEHEVLFEFGANRGMKYLDAKLAMKLRTMLFSPDASASANIAQQATSSDPVRIGVLGLAAPVSDEGTGGDKPSPISDETVRRSGAFNPPASRPDLTWSTRSVTTWPIDVPHSIEQIVYSNHSPAGTVIEHEILLDLEHGTYPLTVDVKLVMIDDHLAQVFDDDEVVTRLLRSGNEDLCKALTDHLARVVPETSRFAVYFNLGPTNSTQCQLKLVGMSLDLSSEGDGSTVSLWKMDANGGRQRAVSVGRFDDVSGRVRFPSLGSQGGSFDGAPLQLLLDLGDLAMVRHARNLTGTLELQHDQLFSELRPFFADATGHLRWGLGLGDEQIAVVKTNVHVQFSVEMDELFANRVSTRHLRLRFPGRSFGREQQHQILTVLHNLAFETPPDLLDDWRVVPAWSVGSTRQHVLLRADITEHEVLRAVVAGGAQSSVTQQAQVKLEDIVLDIAVVGSDADRLAKTSADLHSRIASIFGAS